MAGLALVALACDSGVSGPARGPDAAGLPPDGGAADGAAVNAADAAPAPTLRVVQAQIFTPRCALPGCHVGDGPTTVRPDLSAPTRPDLVDAPSRQSFKPLVRAGSFRDSYLYEKVSGLRPAQGERMPLEGEPLSVAQRRLLREWIDAGAPP